MQPSYIRAGDTANEQSSNCTLSSCPEPTPNTDPENTVPRPRRNAGITAGQHRRNILQDEYYTEDIQRNICGWLNSLYSSIISKYFVLFIRRFLIIHMPLLPSHVGECVGKRIWIILTLIDSKRLCDISTLNVLVDTSVVLRSATCNLVQKICCEEKRNKCDCF